MEVEAAAGQATDTTTQTAPEAPITEPQADTSAPDAAPEAQKPPEPKKDPMSPRFAALAKKEKAIVESHNALKAKEAEIEQRAKATADRVARIERLEKAADAGDYDAVMELLGATKDDDALKKFMTGINSVVLRKKDLPPEVIETMRTVREMRAEAEAQKKAADDAKKKAEDDAKAAKEQAGMRFKVDYLAGPATAFIKKEAEKFEVLSHALAESDTARGLVLEKVWSKMAELYDPKNPTTTEEQDAKLLAKAVESVEDELAKLYAGEISKLLGLKKLQPKKEEPPSPKTGKELRSAAQKLLDGQPATSRPKTLTNSVQQAPVREEAASTDPDVLFQRALKLL
jgi:hypothetical protein